MREVPFVDERECAREPIHLSGAIQPHGYLISCSQPDWVIRHASANVAELFETPVEGVVGSPLLDFLGNDVAEPIARLAELLVPGASPQPTVAANVGVHARMCDIGVHLADGLVHLELEPIEPGAARQMPSVLAQSMVANANDAADMPGFFARCAEQVRALSGYDRVMVYRFRHDGAGEVVAESRDPAIEPYLGLRFPASDIPAQARALYVRNRIRVIPDVEYVPVPVLPGTTAQGAPLDLSQHALRSVAPIHLEYLRNMGVRASMSVSIAVGGRLWGLVACHHRSPRRVSLPARAALDMFSLFASMRVGSQELEQAAERDARVRAAGDALARRMQAAADPALALADALATMQVAVPSDGVAVHHAGCWSCSGVDAAIAEQARAWAQAQAPQRIVATDDAGEWRAPGDAAGPAGVLAASLDGRDDWLLFFRDEQVEDVAWAGDPHKPMVPTDDGVRIAPRKSFASWRETVRGHALPWNEGDRHAAENLRMAMHEHLVDAEAGAAANVTDMAAFRRRHVLQEQKSRLDQLAALLDGLGHLGDAQTTRIGERIAALEAEIRALLQARPMQE